MSDWLCPFPKIRAQSEEFLVALSVAQETKKNPEHEKYSEFYTKMVRQMRYQQKYLKTICRYRVILQGTRRWTS